MINKYSSTAGLFNKKKSNEQIKKKYRECLELNGVMRDAMY